jgi:hypothetical protein
VEPCEEIRPVLIRFFQALRDGDDEAVKGTEGPRKDNPLAVTA